MAAGGVIKGILPPTTAAAAEPATIGACGVHGDDPDIAHGATVLALGSDAEKRRHTRNPGASPQLAAFLGASSEYNVVCSCYGACAGPSATLDAGMLLNMVRILWRLSIL